MEGRCAGGTRVTGLPPPATKALAEKTALRALSCAAPQPPWPSWVERTNILLPRLAADQRLASTWKTVFWKSRQTAKTGRLHRPFRPSSLTPTESVLIASWRSAVRCCARELGMGHRGGRHRLWVTDLTAIWAGSPPSSFDLPFICDLAGSPKAQMATCGGDRLASQLAIGGRGSELRPTKTTRCRSAFARPEGLIAQPMPRWSN